MTEGPFKNGLKHGKFKKLREKISVDSTNDEIREKSVRQGCYKNDFQEGFWTEEFNMFGKASINSFK